MAWNMERAIRSLSHAKREALRKFLQTKEATRSIGACQHPGEQQQHNTTFGPPVFIFALDLSPFHADYGKHITGKAQQNKNIFCVDNYMACQYNRKATPCPNISTQTTGIR